jgi:hypothetical protein
MAHMSDFLENRVIDGHASMTGAGGKFLVCTTAGTSGSTNTLAVPAVGSTLVDSSVTWTAVSGMPGFLNVYVGLFTANPTDTGGGTEVTTSGTAYSRATVACTLANLAGTQAAASTTASTGTGGTTSNNATITVGATPTANWGTITGIGIFDLATSGNLLFWAPLTVNKTVNSGDPAPTFAAAALTCQIDN